MPRGSGGARAGTASGPLLARYDRLRPLFARADQIVVNCGEDGPVGTHSSPARGRCALPADGHALPHMPHTARHTARRCVETHGDFS
eukprot:7389904-Prymnesium_polylepis.1